MTVHSTLRSFAVAAALGGALAASGAAVGEGSQVEATLTYQGKTIKLDRVLIVQHGDEEGLGDGPRLRLFFSNRDIPPSAAGNATTSSAQTFARETNITAVVITADPAGRDRSGRLNILNAPGMPPGGFATSSSTDAFSRLQVAGGRASGAASFTSAEFALKAVFNAPITANPVTSDLLGKPALDSAPAKALIAYNDALKAGDMVALGKYATASRVRQLSQFRQQAGEAAFREVLKEAPTGAEVARSIRRVIVRGPRASVVLTTKEVDEMALEGGAWKMD